MDSAMLALLPAPSPDGRAVAFTVSDHGERVETGRAQTITGRSRRSILLDVGGTLVALGDEPTLSHSTTLSDTLGRCVLRAAPPGVGTDQLMPLRVAKDGYVPASRLVLGGWDGRDVRVELVRNR
jgi:hypothetical protein